MYAASTTDTIANAPAAPALRRRLRDEIVHHPLAPGAQCRVRVSQDPPDERGVRYTRVSGARDDVLGYVAYLFATDTGVGDTAMQIAAVEEDDTSTLTLLHVCPAAAR
jgi:hypothetical protein